MKTLCALVLAASLSAHYTHRFNETGSALPEGHSVSNEIIGHAIGPLALAKALLLNTAAPTPLERIKKAFSENYQYLLGYLILFLATKRFNDAFIHIRYSNYETKTNQMMKKNPKRVLYLSSIGPDDSLSGFPEIAFQEIYGNHPNAVFKTFTNLEDLIRVLKELEEGEKFDRIEFFAHAKPDILLTSDKAKIDLDNVKRLKEAHIEIATVDAEVRFFSCSLAGGRPFDSENTELLEQIGEALLPHGGSVYGATRNLIVLESRFRPNDWKDPPAVWPVRLAVVVTGFGVYETVWVNFLPSFWRNYRASANDFVKVPIERR